MIPEPRRAVNSEITSSSALHRADALILLAKAFTPLMTGKGSQSRIKSAAAMIARKTGAR
jgi:hypothetical protein